PPAHSPTRRATLSSGAISSLVRAKGWGNQTMPRLLSLLGMIAAAVCASAAQAYPVGERHLVTTDATAALRDAAHRPQVRVTVWYPAAEGAVEERIDLGPPGKPLFVVGAVAQDAPFADARRRPVILFSHGFG